MAYIARMGCSTARGWEMLARLEMRVFATSGLSGSHFVIGLVAKMHLLHTRLIPCMREGIPIAPSTGGGCEIH